MRIALLLLLLIPVASLAQKKEDSKIIITLTDTAAVREKVKKAFARQDFMVKELEYSDTLSTFPTEYNGIHIIGFAEVKGNQVTLFGLYGLKRINSFGYTNAAKNYKRILYFKASKSWPLLQRVAESMGGEITYKK